MDINEKLFITGFNSGYLLAEFEPQLLILLLNNVQPNNSYMRGIFAGQKEFELGKETDKLDTLKMLRQKKRDEKSLGRD